LVVTTKAKRFSFPIANNASAPERKVRPDATFEFGVEDLSAIHAAFHCASKDSTRPHLCCVSIDGDVAVATDGHRLTVRALSKKFKRVLIPDRIVSVICEKQSATITTDGAGMVIVADDVHMTTACVDAIFPPYKQTIPESHDVKVTVNTKELLDVLRSARVGGDGTEMVVLDIAESAITITRTGESEFHSVVDCTSDGKRTIGINALFLIEAAQSFADKTLTIKMTDPLSPIVESGDDSRDVEIIMPMRVT